MNLNGYTLHSQDSQCSAGGIALYLMFTLNYIMVMRFGSVLGPLLFLIFINDLPNVSKFLTFFLFADDTNIYHESSDLLEIQKVANRELPKVRKCLEADRLVLSIDKTNFVIFHSRQHKLTDDIFLKMGRRKTKQESCVKFLELLLDSNLSGSSILLNYQKSLQGLLVCSTRFAIMLSKIHLFCYIIEYLNLSYL